MDQVDKLNKIINKHASSVSEFASLIGVHRVSLGKTASGDTKKGVSLNLANKINTVFPQYTVQYLLSDEVEGSVAKEPEVPYQLQGTSIESAIAKEVMRMLQPEIAKLRTEIKLLKAGGLIDKE